MTKSMAEELQEHNVTVELKMLCDAGTLRGPKGPKPAPVQNQLQSPELLSPGDPEAGYPVRDLDPDEFATAVSDAIRGLPAPVINVQVPEQPARSRKIRRDAAGNISEIVEE